MSNGATMRQGAKRGVRGLGAIALLAFLGACANDMSSHAGPMQAGPQLAQDPKNGDGIGGTGVTPTGTLIRRAQVSPRGRGDGIGGTGVVGTISGFGSIIVNGLELEFSRNTNVANDGAPASLEELKI